LHENLNLNFIKNPTLKHRLIDNAYTFKFDNSSIFPIIKDYYLLYTVGTAVCRLHICYITYVLNAFNDWISETYPFNFQLAQKIRTRLTNVLNLIGTIDPGKRIQ